MIFLIQKIRNSNRIEVIVYESLDNVAQRIEWQDILDNTLKILDEVGNLYAWDDSKKNELGTVYNYSFKRNGTDLALIRHCKEKFMQLGQPDCFEMEAID